MKKAILAVLFLLVASLALAEEKLSDEKQAEMERKKLREQWDLFEKELTENVYSVLFNRENTTPEECQRACQKIEEILDKEESFAKQHHEYYGNLLQDVNRCLKYQYRLRENEESFRKCAEILDSIIYTKTESGFLCSWNMRRMALEKLVLFSMESDKPEFKKKIFANRAKMVEAYLLTWQEFKEKFPPELDAEMKKLLKDWDDYRHSEEYPKDFLPTGSGWYSPVLPAEYVEDVAKRPVYKQYLEGYQKAEKYFRGEKERKYIRAKYPDSIIEFTTELYSEPPFATDELKEIMKKNNLEEEIQEDILQEITAAEKKHKAKEKKKAHQKKTKQKAAKAETVSPEE